MFRESEPGPRKKEGVEDYSEEFIKGELENFEEVLKNPLEGMTKEQLERIRDRMGFLRLELDRREKGRNPGYTESLSDELLQGDLESFEEILRNPEKTRSKEELERIRDRIGQIRIEQRRRKEERGEK